MINKREKKTRKQLLSMQIRDVVVMQVGLQQTDLNRNQRQTGPTGKGLGITMTTSKKCKETLAVPIHILWSYSMTIGKVPDFYKSSYISPLHKKDSRALPGNYRPISLTSHIIKIYERVLRKKLVEYLESNNLLCSNQHGFRSGRSCLTQLLHHFDDVMESISNNCDFDSIYLDYAKAFDKVDHQLLISKLNIYGIHPKLIT